MSNIQPGDLAVVVRVCCDFWREHLDKPFVVHSVAPDTLSCLTCGRKFDNVMAVKAHVNIGYPHSWVRKIAGPSVAAGAVDLQPLLKEKV